MFVSEALHQGRHHVLAQCLVAIVRLEHLLLVERNGGETHPFKVWPLPSGCMEREFRMLAHIYCPLFISFTDFDLLTAINFPVD
jgi:hypothetical protein